MCWDFKGKSRKVTNSWLKSQCWGTVPAGQNKIILVKKRKKKYCKEDFPWTNLPFTAISYFSCWRKAQDSVKQSSVLEHSVRAFIILKNKNLSNSGQLQGEKWVGPGTVDWYGYNTTFSLWHCMFLNVWSSKKH